MSLDNINDNQTNSSEEANIASQDQDQEVSGPTPPRVTPPKGLAHVTVPTPENPEGIDTDAEFNDFDTLIDSYIDGIVQHEMESIILVPVVDVQSDHVLVDLGDKAEGGYRYSRISRFQRKRPRQAGR